MEIIKGFASLQQEKSNKLKIINYYLFTQSKLCTHPHSYALHTPLHKHTHQNNCKWSFRLLLRLQEIITNV